MMDRLSKSHQSQCLQRRSIQSIPGLNRPSYHPTERKSMFKNGYSYLADLMTMKRLWSFINRLQGEIKAGVYISTMRQFLQQKGNHIKSQPSDLNSTLQEACWDMDPINTRNKDSQSIYMVNSISPNQAKCNGLGTTVNKMRNWTKLQVSRTTTYIKKISHQRIVQFKY